MKKSYLAFALVAAAVLAAGCKKDQGAEGYVTLNATIDNQTKMYIDDNRYPCWDNGDEVYINADAYSVSSASGNSASIVGVAAAEAYRAVYPASLVAVGTDITGSGSIAIELPATQVYATANGHQRVDVPMAAYLTEGTTLQFHNICSVVRVAVSNATGEALTLDRIVVEAQNAALSGAATATVSGTAFDGVSMSATASHATTLSFAGSTVTVPASGTGTFDIVVPPFTNDNITITLYNTDDAYCEIVKSGVSLAQNTIANVAMTVGSLTERWVDLGLPSGLLWATCNVGATSPEEYGDYFAWGETTPKTTYDWATYAWCNGSQYTLTKYCDNAAYGYNGFTDNLTILQPGDDAATVNYGGRTPTREEWQELSGNTTSEWTTQNGVDGRRFTGSNGNSLFLPAAGLRWGSSLYSAGSLGFYWSSSLYPDYPIYAWSFGFNSDGLGVYYNYGRYYGFSVRAVRQN